MNLSILDRAADMQSFKANLPEPAEVVAALLKAEKTARKNHPNYTFEQLIGTWKLRFITGTKKTRQRAGIVLGAGRYLPSFVAIELTYSNDESEEKQLNLRGRVKNSVKLGGLNLTLTGPVKFLAPRSILAFDFTTITIKLFKLQLYNGYLKNGQAKEAEFYSQKINNQAFFSYFLITENIIAARGRGGGLALWSRLS